MKIIMNGLSKQIKAHCNQLSIKNKRANLLMQQVKKKDHRKT